MCARFSSVIISLLVLSFVLVQVFVFSSVCLCFIVSVCISGWSVFVCVGFLWALLPETNNNKIRGGGTLHSGVGPRQWSCAFS